MARRLLSLSLLVLAAADGARAACCADCLAQTDPANKVLTYDAVVHDQCSAAKGICCYGCQFSHGGPTYDAGVSFDDKGDATTTAGQVVKLSMSGITRVTFDFLATNQPKTSFVGNRSSEAPRVDGAFQLCARAAGVIAFRGWGADACSQVSREYTIKVAAGDGTKTCDAGVVKPADPSAAPTPSPQSNQPVRPQTGGENDVDSCSPTRGAIKARADGSKFCECLGDWRNPPQCDQYSWTKTILTVLGGLAAVLSIAFTVRAYIKSKKAEREARENSLDEVTESEIETMRVSPAKQQRDGSITVLPPTSTTAGSRSSSPATGGAAAVAGRGVRSPARSPAALSGTTIKTSGHETTL
ncbi:hypothetical protein P43SY_005086 [Pythium insidiosum]|uniref:Uncharacterized protein n=1 Tax=Pythium insidiosum TaxID=114742 RepID=A0AAD5LJR4_PYTIN|nr:hypothetical protein P43SY_005086 [Pythium insidiosum]